MFPLHCELGAPLNSVFTPAPPPPTHTRTYNHTCHQQVGWDVFSLHYELGAPLNSVFTPGSLSAYRRVAKLQWRLVRAERSLGLAWRTLKVGRRSCLAWAC